MSGRRRDRGLAAVARVREVRTRDSRLGLQQAIAEQLELQRRLDLLQEERDARVAVPTGTLDMSSFAARQAVLLAQGAAVRQAQREVDTAEVVRDAAAQHWRADKTRLSAVESLLEVRRQERLAEAARAAARDLDETGTQGWTRRARRTEGEQ